MDIVWSRTCPDGTTPNYCHMSDGQHNDSCLACRGVRLLVPGEWEVNCDGRWVPATLRPSDQP